MTDTDRLAERLVEMIWGGLDAEERADYGMPMEDVPIDAGDLTRSGDTTCRAFAAQLIAAGITLAATPAPLDVKRLARALHAVEPYAGENNCEVNYHADDAAAIAAAYAEEPT